MIFAYILIIIGVLFFLKNAGIFVWNWSIVWPLLLICLGVHVAWVWRKVSVWLGQAWEKIAKKLE